jgi:ubiquinone/menaquinone biosynthesis C-methylase UbiE
VDRRSLAAAYDRSAAGYDERFRALQREKFRAATPWLSVGAGALCLDAGGGTGLLCEWAREESPALAAARWVLLDASPDMLRGARGRAAALLCGDLAALPLRDGAFPLVCAFTSVLGDADRALRELWRAVAPRGRLVASFLRDEAPRSLALPAGHALAERHPAGQDLLFVLGKE